MSAIKLNPTYFPRTERGRPGEKEYEPLLEQVFDIGRRGRPRVIAYWKLEIYDKDDNMLDSIFGQGTKPTAMAEAQSFVGKTYNGVKIKRVVLDGPFDSLDEIDVEEVKESKPVKVKKISSAKPAATPLPFKVGQLVKLKNQMALVLESDPSTITVRAEDGNTYSIPVSQAKSVGRGRPSKYETELKTRLASHVHPSKKYSEEAEMARFNPRGKKKKRTVEIIGKSPISVRKFR